MRELNYIVGWGNNKEKAWSGTSYSLYKSLTKYFTVFDYDITNHSVLIRAINRLLNDKFNILEIKRLRKKTKKIEGVCVQTTEIVENNSSRQTYIYMDLSVSYLQELSTVHSPQFRYSGFGSIPPEMIAKRYIIQQEYFKNCSGILTMGRWLEKYLRDENPDLVHKIHHVGGGINLDKTKINYSHIKSKNKVLFIGRDFERKGGYIVVEAFKKLKSSMPDLELHIAGPSSNPLQEKIEGLIFYGDVTSDKVSELMNKCDVFCMPSYFEAYGLVFIEALAYGLPCIGRNCFEMPYFIEDGETGLLLQKDDPHELAQKMKELLINPSYTQNVLARKDRYIQEYSWDNVARRIKDVIDLS